MQVEHGARRVDAEWQRLSENSHGDRFLRESRVVRQSVVSVLFLSPLDNFAPNCGDAPEHSYERLMPAGIEG